MPVRAPIDLTDVEVDFSAIGTTGSHSSTTTTTAATAVTSASATRANVAALLASAGGRAEGDKDAASNNGEDGGGGSGAAAAAAAASRAYDPAMQTYMQRHLQQQQRRRQRGMSFFAPSKVTDTTAAAAAEEEATAPPPQQRVRIEAYTGATPALVATRTNDNSSNSNGNASSAQRTHGGDGDNSDDAAALFVAEATSAGQPGVTRARHRAYLRALRRLCRHDASTAADDDDEDDNDDNDTEAAATTATVTAAHALLASPARAFSMLQQLFDDGVPDVEPWDQWAFVVPRYDVHALVTNNNSSSSSKDAHELVRYVHHAVLPDSHYTTHYQHRDEDAAAVAQRAREQQQQLQRMQTPKERRAERRAKQQAKQQAARAVAAAAALPASAVTTSSSSSSSTTTTTAADGSTATLTSAPVRDRLSTRALALQLFTRSVLNPLAAETRVLDQYEQRYIEHQRRNHERHVAALPAQVAKRARDVARHARERPLLRAYRVCRVYTPAQLAMLRHFANDQRLRGFVLWVAQCDALIVLAGGEVALRHLDQWIVTKMQWHDAATRARRLCTVALPDAHTFSFHRKGRKTATAAATAATATDAEAAHESVFLSFVDTVEQGEAFMRTVVPAPGSPWRDMSAVWRLAFLADGLAVRRA